MDRRREILRNALLGPTALSGISPSQWNDVLLAAREQGLLAHLETKLADANVLEAIPNKARQQMHAAAITAASSQTAVRFELNRVMRSLKGFSGPIILLKGIAYLMAGLPPARGRFIGDLDLMVPFDQIERVEAQLVAEGWETAELEPYDQRFYRQWMHEIPPLQHPQRETPVDLHHSIAPRTSRVTPAAGAMIADSVPLHDDPRLRVLCPADMVLHSTVHLFNDEVGKPLRDLFDLHGLLIHFGSEPGFWSALLSRARLHGLSRPLYYMMRHCRRVLGTAIPCEVQKEAAARGAPLHGLNRGMDLLFDAAFLQAPVAQQSVATRLAHGLLYVRSHWLRMPPLMLARHLTIKALRRTRERFSRGTQKQTTN